MTKACGSGTRCGSGGCHSSCLSVGMRWECENRSIKEIRVAASVAQQCKAGCEGVRTFVSGLKEAVFQVLGLFRDQQSTNMAAPGVFSR